MNNLNEFVNSNVPDIDLITTSINFILCVLMSFITRSFYINFSTSLTGKHHIGTIIPILSTIVFMVILVVKSSLALSLGLVGALSIVRFRTPIKEPEELVYLFLSIAIGLGYAAGYTVVTTAITFSILLIVFFFLSNKQIGSKDEYNLVITWNNKDITYEKILNEIMNISSSLKLLRLNNGPVENTIVLLIVPSKNIKITQLTETIKNIDPKIDTTFYESKTNW